MLSYRIKTYLVIFFLKKDISAEEVRSRVHINKILHLNDQNKNNNEIEMKTKKMNNIILRDLKKLYENSIKPLETVYKYRDLSNRHFGGIPFQ